MPGRLPRPDAGDRPAPGASLAVLQALVGMTAERLNPPWLAAVSSRVLRLARDVVQQMIPEYAVARVHLIEEGSLCGVVRLFGGSHPAK